MPLAVIVNTTQQEVDMGVGWKVLGSIPPISTASLSKMPILILILYAAP